MLKFKTTRWTHHRGWPIPFAVLVAVGALAEARNRLPSASNCCHLEFSSQTKQVPTLLCDPSALPLKPNRHPFPSFVPVGDF